MRHIRNKSYQPRQQNVFLSIQTVGNMKKSPIARQRVKVLAMITLATITLLGACTNKPSPVDQGDPWAQVLEKGHGTLKALYVPAEGFAYRDEHGTLTGVTVELIKELADFVREKYGANIEVEFEKEEDWRVFYTRIVNGGDGLIGFGNVTITEERKNELVFSPPYMNNTAALITHRDMPVLNSLDELSSAFEGMKALAFEGTLHEKRLRKLVNEHFPASEVHFAASNDEIVERVSENTTYFAYIDLYNYVRATNRGVPLKRHPIGDDSAEQFGYVMPLGTTWDAIIKQYFLHNDGLTGSKRYKHIMEEHLGKNLARLLQ